MLGRFIFASNQFSRENDRVKFSAFIPPSNGRLSVFRVSALGEDEIWSIGENVERKRKESNPLLARADVAASNVTEMGLQVEPDDNPPRHANIVGWPKEKSEIRLRAMELAAKARLHLRPAS